MVGRLVEQQHIGFLQQQTAQSHTAALTTREVLHAPVARRTVQGGHGALQLRVHIPSVGGIDNVLQLSLPVHKLFHLVGVLIVFRQAKLHINLVVFGQGIVDVLHAFHDILFHRFLLVQGRVLRQITHGIAGAPHYVALILLIEAGNDFHER